MGDNRVWIAVRLFALARQRAGRPTVEVELAEPATVADLRRVLAEGVPELADLLPRALISVDSEYADDAHPIAESSEVAVIPPVSGGLSMIEITESPIDFSALTERVRSNRAGAVCLFLGTVREITGERRTAALDYEAYPEMAARKLAELEAEARGRWPILDVALVHRVGHLDLGEVSVAVAVGCPHRDQAFEACRWLIDTLKQVVPIWKKETWADGSEEWVHPGLDPETTASRGGGD